jgi:hypothetical protein
MPDIVAPINANFPPIITIVGRDLYAKVEPSIKPVVAIVDPSPIKVLSHL